MTPPVATNLRALAAGMVARDVDRTALKDAIWLYCWLIAMVNSSGHVNRTRASLAADLGTTENEVARHLSLLDSHNLIRVLVPSPYLVIRMSLWRDSITATTRTTAENTLPNDALSNVPVPGSSKLLPEQQPKAAPAAGVDGGAGEGEGLLAQAQSRLGPVDGAALQKLLAQHPPPAVRAALARVARTPQGRIRKSRFALFRYLLIHASTPHDHDTPHQP